MTMTETTTETKVVQVNLQNLIDLWKLTDNNQHSEATLELAKLLQDPGAIEIAEKILQDHMRQGFISIAGQQLRAELQQSLLNSVKLKFGRPMYYLMKAAL